MGAEPQRADATTEEGGPSHAGQRPSTGRRGSPPEAASNPLPKGKEGAVGPAMQTGKASEHGQRSPPSEPAARTWDRTGAVETAAPPIAPLGATRERAKATAAAVLSIRTHRRSQAMAVAKRRSRGASRAFVRASSRTNSDASSLHRPPVSRATTTHGPRKKASAPSKQRWWTEFWKRPAESMSSNRSQGSSP